MNLIISKIAGKRLVKGRCKMSIPVLVLCFIGLCLILSLCSCKKYLDERPNNSLSTPTSVSDLQSLLDNPATMTSRTTPSYSQASDDDYFLLPVSYNSLPNSDLRDAYRWSPFPYYFNNDWSFGYRAVYITNLCLELLDNLEKTSVNALEWDNVKGSALFFRAYYFQQLAWTFSKAFDESTSDTDLGICLRLSSDFSIVSTRANVSETYEQIIKDARESLFYLPSISSHVIRPSKAAAYGLLARTFWSMRQYDKAQLYADSCLQLKNTLIDFKPPFNPAANVPFAKYDNPETILYTDISNFSVPFTTARGGLVDTILYSSYGTGDLRKTAYFSPGTGTTAGYFRFKGMYTGSSSLYFSGIATDEILLIRAEAYARAGNKDSALADLNTLLRKRHTAAFVDVFTVDVQTALDRILLERRKELLFRGLRWIDIKRLNKEGRNITPTRIINGQIRSLQPNANYYALPLPNDIINLTGMPQNPY